MEIPDLCELIVKKQMKIEKLENELRNCKERMKNIHYIIFGIGGPLNDNKNQYSKKQMAEWGLVARQIDD